MVIVSHIKFAWHLYLLEKSFPHCNELRSNLQAIPWCTIREPSSLSHQYLASSIGFEFLISDSGLNVISTITMKGQFDREENVAVFEDNVRVHMLPKCLRKLRRMLPTVWWNGVWLVTIRSYAWQIHPSRAALRNESPYFPKDHDKGVPQPGLSAEPLLSSSSILDMWFCVCPLTIVYITTPQPSGNSPGMPLWQVNSSCQSLRNVSPADDLCS